MGNRVERITSYEDLEVYQKLCDLHIEVCKLTLIFSDFEKYELGGQLRRSSNSAPANLAEGWNNKHIKIYIEGVNRALGELQETKHHLTMALRKGYLTEERYRYFIQEYNSCGKMLKSLGRSLEQWKK